MIRILLMSRNNISFRDREKHRCLYILYERPLKYIIPKIILLLHTVYNVRACNYHNWCRNQYSTIFNPVANMTMNTIEIAEFRRIYVGNIKPCNDVPKWQALRTWCITVILCFWRGGETCAPKVYNICVGTCNIIFPHCT